MKTKRKKTIVAGRIVRSYIYDIAMPKDLEPVRTAKKKFTTKARQRQNHRKSTNQLEMLLSTNFKKGDLKVELTYSDEFLPNTVEAAKQTLRNFLKRLTRRWKKKGKELKYIYVTESLHKRVHHHLVINSVDNADLKDIETLWGRGIVEVKKLWSCEHYADLANYMTKEAVDDKKKSSRRYSSSLNLDKPSIDSRWADDNETIEAPKDSIIVEADSYINEWGEYKYIKYILPEKKKTKPKRKRSKAKKKE